MVERNQLFLSRKTLLVTILKKKVPQKVRRMLNKQREMVMTVQLEDSHLIQPRHSQVNLAFLN